MIAPEVVTKFIKLEKACGQDSVCIVRRKPMEFRCEFKTNLECLYFGQINKKWLTSSGTEQVEHNSVLCNPIRCM